MIKYTVSIRLAYNSLASVEVEAFSEQEAFTKGLRILKEGNLARYLPMNPRAFAKIVPNNAKDLPIDNR